MAAMYVVTLLALCIVSIGATFAPFKHMPQLLQRRQTYCGRELEACVAPLSRWSHPTTGLKLARVSHEEILDQLCGDAQTALGCISGLVDSGCGRGDQQTEVMLETVEGVVNYMCSDEGRQALLLEGECWVNADLEQGIQDCSDQMEDRAMFMVDQSQICGLLEDFRTCTVDIVRGKCSQRAVDFVDSILYYALKPSADAFLDNCQISRRAARDVTSSLMKLFKRSAK